MEDQDTGNAPDSGEQNQNQNQNQNQDTGNEQQTADMVPKTSLDEVNGKFDAMTKELDALVSAEVETLPEDMRDIVPDLAPVAKLKWLNAAKAKGVFNKAPVRTSDPDSKRPSNSRTTDMEGMTPDQLIELGLKG
jgi:hypothetical protein